MISTTLMTFLLITKPEVRSVKLLGSWDNFSRQYVMERDKRVGPGHWKGCHTFTDIIGDGPDKSQWRTGGLKMGGTYWYYYLLDDDIEYYNEREPATTSCPLLPGQPVNVLNVPIILPDSRSHERSGSSGSTKSEYRTMNPEDKFMNPRKPPPQPQPVRLQTSTSVRRQLSPAMASISPIAGMVHRSKSQPNSATRRSHRSKDSRSMSPPRARALRAALGQTNAMEARVPETWQSNNASNESVETRRNVPGIRINAGIAIPSSPNAPNKLGPSTLQSRRALKTGDGAPGRLLTVQTRPGPRGLGPSRINGNNAAHDESRAIRNALEDIANSSDLPTPTKPFAKKEKRLPTLPNSPSSVMDEAVRAIDERDKAMDAEVLRSHFSSMTMTDDSIHSRIIAERSRFSEWSTDTETDDYNTPESMVSTSTFNQDYNSELDGSDDRWTTPELSQSGDAATNTDPNTPHLTVHSKPSSPNSASGEGDLPWNVSLPHLTVSLSSPSINGSGLGIEGMDEVESNPKRHAALFSALESMEALAMSRSPNSSPVILPQILRDSVSERNISGQRRPSHQTESIRSRRSNADLHGGNATMQELMDELSYLKNIIQAEMDGTPF
ncbi:uncharacterized protein N7511_008769 [Penicillium nucicola]|uniref:uncharacterized protein n=1 Tax=Penicillium nucicola TaxID=1850975 RepID=UPI0025458830|nr:uncharacterized protein N7511_008769 [Penicillium nucicola]KAJ5747073.1 hypothetical protein N7511_008769 [Penicillium nucicola]